jgi:GNAT superfamily N-acetyltransferase
MEAGLHSDSQAEGAAVQGRIRYVAQVGGEGRVVGSGEAWHVRLRKYRLHVAVDAAWRRRGIGGVLLERLLGDLQGMGAESVQARVLEDDTESYDFLRRRGFVQTQRMRRLSLAVQGADPSRWLPLRERLEARGVLIRTLAEEQERDRDCLRRLHALQSAVLPAWPDPDPGPAPVVPYEEYVRSLDESGVAPEAFFVAKVGREYVGYSGLAWREGETERLFSAGTAVRGEYRGQGIATALKACTVGYAREHGHSEILTDTASMAMLAVNLKVGFRPRGPAEVRLVRGIRTAG